MNFKICEGQIARWLETLAAYDFEIKYRPGIKHLSADSLSRRPCVNENCANCDRYEEKYLSFDLHPGVATKNIGVQNTYILLGK